MHWVETLSLIVIFVLGVWSLLLLYRAIVGGNINKSRSVSRPTLHKSEIKAVIRQHCDAVTDTDSHSLDVILRTRADYRDHTAKRPLCVLLKDGVDRLRVCCREYQTTL